MRRIFLVCLMLGSVFLSGPQETAAVPGGCPVEGATLITVGQNDPLTGFPATLLDSDGNALELCRDGAFCFFDPIEVGNPFSEQIGFGGEGFWWSAEAQAVDPDTGNSALIVLAAEAAFNPGVVADGNQFPFTRMRVRIDAPQGGTYTVTHPYGQNVYVVPIAGLRAINETVDISFAAGEDHQGRVGPFLVWDSLVDPQAPTGFVGDINIPHQVTGSPCGTNFFQVSAVDTDLNPIDLNGAGVAGNDLVTDLFSVQGKIFNGLLTTPLTADRVSYSRPSNGGAGRVNIFASATTNATVTAERSPQLSLVTLEQNGGRFFTSYQVANTGSLPASVIVTASAAGFNDGVAVAPLVDEVKISIANYDVINKRLAVQATSSDLRLPLPTLTLSDALGTVISGHTRIFNNVLVPPSTVTVTSSAGGMATKEVSVVEPSSILMFIPAMVGGAQRE